MAASVIELQHLLIIPTIKIIMDLKTHFFYFDILCMYNFYPCRLSEPLQPDPTHYPLGHVPTSIHRDVECSLQFWRLRAKQVIDLEPTNGKWNCFQA